MKEILKILKNYKFVKKDFFLLLFFGILMESLYVVFPQFARIIIEIIETSGDLKDLYFWLIIFGCFIFFSLLTAFIYKYFTNRVWLYSFSRKEQFYREELFKKNYKDILDIGTGKLITRITSGVRSEMDIFLSTVSILVSAVFRGIIVIIILAFYIPNLILVVLFGIVLLFVINYFVRGYIKKYNKIEQELDEIDGKNRAKIIMENLIIRMFGKVDYELKKSKEILEKIPYYGVKVETANNLFYDFLELTLRFLELGVYFVIGTLIIKEGTFQISYLVMLTGYIWFLWWPLDKAISNINHINRVWEKYKKLDTFMQEKIDIKNGRKDYIYKKGKIKINNLCFGYSKSKLIFNDFSLDLLQGKKNAFVGHSGGGKSTITKILLRLYDYKSGEIFIDDQDLKTLKVETFYKYIGYLPQEPSVFDGTIRENLEYAFDENHSQVLLSNEGSRNNDDLIWEALRKAKIDDMIRGLEKGLETEVGEKGVKLSGGEKQRLAIARIFLKNPKIIILDEPTSALDSISEAAITESLDELMKGRTSIIIAHRLQTVMHSDKIIVLENGKIESEGKHEVLMQKSNVYKTLVDLQNGRIEE